MGVRSDRRRGVTGRRVLAGLVAALLALMGYLGGVWRSAPDVPGDTSVEVGFARDMSIHHAQAVTLAKLAHERATLPVLRDMTEDIVITQEREIGVMSAWLQQWRVAGVGSAPPMRWMAHRVVPSPDADPPMPGMATRQEVATLAVTRGPEADRLFCQLMLRHHLGGLHMIDEVVARGHRAEVIALARQMRADQGREITRLQDVLRRLGG
jgi:uncharacterized protein (DUF305 family)